MKARISDSGYAIAYPHRINVCSFGRGNWEVWQGWEVHAMFPTHAEAIEYAHEQATIQALAAHFTIPPENPVAAALKEGA